MLRKAFAIVWFLFTAAVAVIALYIIWKGGFRHVETQGIEYKDFISILLTALGVMIALAALLVAMLAVWTYKNAMELITDASRKAARERVDEVVPDLVEDALRFAREEPADAARKADEIASSYSRQEGKEGEPK